MLVAAVDKILVDHLPYLVAVLEVSLHFLEHWQPNCKDIVRLIEHLTSLHVLKAILEQQTEVSWKLVHVLANSFEALVRVHKNPLRRTEKREVVFFLLLFLLLLSQIVLGDLAYCFLDLVNLVGIFLFTF